MKYYADEKTREWWRNDFPDCVMPPQEEAPYSRDVILPRPDDELGPDARAWLRANPSLHAFATNRFPTTADALALVEGLHAAGATAVTIDNIRFLPGSNWLPYADTLIVRPPDGEARHALVDYIEQHGRPDEDGGEQFADRGQSPFRLWWD